MFNVVSSAAIGFFAKASCDFVPKVSWRSSSFKLSFCIASFKPPSCDNISGQRPFVTVISSDKKKKTELATWCQEQGEWQFRETITLEVMPDEDITIQVSCSQQYDLVFAAVDLASSLIGEVCFPVSSVLPKLVAEDRDLDGLVHTTPVMGFDLLNKGSCTGRIYVSMETRHPPSQKSGSNTLAIADSCMNTKGIADKDPNSNIDFGQGPSAREHMQSARGASWNRPGRGNSEQYSETSGYISERSNSDRYHQPSRNSPWA